MKLEEIAAVKGKSELFKILKTTSSGMVLKPLNSIAGGTMAISAHGVTVLSEISIYTTTKEKMTPLKDVLQNIWGKFGDTLTIEPNADQEALRAFMKSVLPNYHEERVYTSDIKKLIKWYPTLLKHATDIIKGTKEDVKKKKESVKAKSGGALKKQGKQKNVEYKKKTTPKSKVQQSTPSRRGKV